MNKIYGIGDEEELAEDLQKELPNRIIAELEKIKAEIHDIKLELDCDYYTGDKITRLIDNHIEELKGEQE